MADEKRNTGTKPLPALEDNGGAERGEDPSNITGDWYGQEAAEAVEQASVARQGLEDDLSRLLSRSPGPEPGSSQASDDVAYAATQELAVLEDTAPKLPAAQEIGVLDDTAPTLPTAQEMGVSTKLAPNAPRDPRPAPMPPRAGRVAEACNEVVVFSEEQRLQVEQAILRKKTPQQALAPMPTEPVQAERGGRGLLLLGLLIACVVVATGLIWVFYLA